MADMPREIHVKLTADTSEYIASMEAATAATRALTDLLRSIGIAEADLPSAIRAVASFRKTA